MSDLDPFAVLESVGRTVPRSKQEPLDPFAVLEDAGPPTAVDRIAAPFQSFAGGAMHGTAGLLEGQALVERQMPDPFGIRGALGDPGVGLLEGAAGVLRSAAPEAHPELAGSFAAGDVPSALGSTMPFFAAGLLGGGLGIAPALTAGYAGAVTNGSQEFYTHLRARPGDEEGAWTAFSVGAVGGAAEGLPIGRILNRVNKASGGGLQAAITAAFVEGLEEGAQETSQQVLSNLIAAHLRDEDVEALEGVLRSGGAGALSGVLLSALGSRAARGTTEGPRNDQPGTTGGPPDLAPVGSDAAPEGPEAVQPDPGATLPPHGGHIDATSAADTLIRANLARGHLTPEEAAAARVVTPDDPESVFDREFVEQRGGTLTLVDAGRPLPLRGALADAETGSIVLDASLPAGERRRAVVAHEMLHLLRAREDGSQTAWEDLYGEIQRLDPQGLQDATVRAGGAQAAAGVQGADVREEGLSYYAEGLQGWMSEVMTQPGRLEAVLEGADRGLVQRILDAVVRLLQRAGLNVQDSRARALRALHAEVASAGPEVALDPEVAARAALAVREAFDGMVGGRAPARQSATRPAVAPQPVMPTEPDGPRQGPIRRRLAPVVAQPIAPPPLPEPTPKLTSTQRKRLRQKAGRLETRARRLLGQSYDPQNPGARRQYEIDVAEARAARAGAAKARFELERVEAMERMQRERRAPRAAQARRAEPSRAQSAIDAFEAGSDGPFAAATDAGEVPFSTAPPFYSALTTWIAGLPQSKLSTTQLDAMAKKAPGVTQEELQWVNWDDMLKGRKRVTKDEVLEWLRANQVRVEEKVLGGDYTRNQVRDSRVETIEFEGRPAWRIVSPGGFQVGFSREGPEEAWEDAREFFYDSDAPRGENEPRHADPHLQLPGGENYREVLLVLPPKEGAELPPGFSVYREAGGGGSWGVEFPNGSRVGGWPSREAAIASQSRQSGHPQFTSSHFSDTPNVLAHIRMNDRTDAEGGRMLFVEEIQSDWHQEGRKKGYATEPDPAAIKRAEAALAEAQRQWDEASAYLKTVESQEWSKPEDFRIAKAKRKKKADAYYARRDELEAAKRPGGVPDAPWKKDWPTLALKRAIKLAADEGYDSIGWTTGAQQVGRYETAFRAQVDSIEWEGMPAGLRGKRVIAKKGGRAIFNATVNDQGVVDAADAEASNVAVGKPLEDLVGKSIATEILSKPEGSIEREGLTIGGKGMEDFYDKILVNAANKLGKRFGVRAGVGEVEVDEGERTVTRSEFNGRPVFQVRSGGAVESTHPTADAAWEAAEALDRAPVHTLPLTDDMRATVRERGFSTFAAKFSAQDPTNYTALTIPSENFRSRMLSNWADKLHRVVQTQEAIGDITEDLDVVAKARVFEPKVKAKVDEMERQYWKPIAQVLRGLGADYETYSEYLAARHAPDRNAHVIEGRINDEVKKRLAAIRKKAKRGEKVTATADSVRKELLSSGWKPKFGHEANPGSGMRTSRAREVVAAREAENPGWKRLGELVDRLNAARLDVAVEFGLMSQEQADGWRERLGPHYVPLRTDMSEFQPTARPGRGFSIPKGPLSKRARGRSSMADDPLGFSFQQYMETVFQAGRNEVGQTLGKMVRENPDPAFWEIEPLPEPEVGEDGVERDAFMDPRYKLDRERVVVFKEGGKPYSVLFADKSLAKALNGMGVDKVPAAIRFLGKVTRGFSKLVTIYDPEFVFSNFARDVQTAGLNLTGEQKAKMAARVMAGVPGAMKASYRVLGNHDAAGRYEDAFREMEQAGGFIEWFYQPTLEEHRRHLEREIRGFDPKNPKTLLRALYRLGEAVERVNKAVENAVRLSAYVEARKDGATTQAAANLARSLTVDFNRRGFYSTWANSLYAFFNASTQGVVRFLWSVGKHKKVRAVVGVLAAEAFVRDMYNRAIAGDDDDGENRYDKIPEYIKDRNLILMLPKGKSFTSPFSGKEVPYLHIPLPYGFNIVHTFGRSISSAVSGAVSPMEAAGNVVASAWGAMSPIGSEATPTQVLSPTITDPLVQIGENKTFFGGPIMPQAFDRNQPDSQRYFDNVSEPSRVMTKFLNEATGGDKYKPGLVDISPETIDHVWDFVSGGPGKLARRTGKTFEWLQGGTVDDKDIPFWRKVVGQMPRGQVNRSFREKRDLLDRNRKRIEEGLLQVSAPEYQRLQRLLAAFKAADKRARQLQEAADAADSTERRKSLEAQKEALQARMIRLFNETGSTPEVVNR